MAHVFQKPRFSRVILLSKSTILHKKTSVGVTTVPISTALFAKAGRISSDNLSVISNVRKFNIMTKLYKLISKNPLIPRSRNTCQLSFVTPCPVYVRFIVKNVHIAPATTKIITMNRCVPANMSDSIDLFLIRVLIETRSCSFIQSSFKLQ